MFLALAGVQRHARVGREQVVAGVVVQHANQSLRLVRELRGSTHTHVQLSSFQPNVHEEAYEDMTMEQWMGL